VDQAVALIRTRPSRGRPLPVSSGRTLRGQAPVGAAIPLSGIARRIL